MNWDFGVKGESNNYLSWGGNFRSGISERESKKGRKHGLSRELSGSLTESQLRKRPVGAGQKDYIWGEGGALRTEKAIAERKCRAIGVNGGGGISAGRGGTRSA